MADFYGPYLERVGGHSPCSAAFSRRGGGRSQRKYLIGSDGTPNTVPITDVSQIYGAILELVGSTSTHSDGIRLARTLPRSDPLFPWLFCEDISIQGQGRFTKQPADPFGVLETSTVEDVALYPTYELGVNFTPRPYVHAKDNQIRTGSLVYTDQQGVASSHFYAEEWKRYTNIERMPAGDFLVAEAGQMVLDVASGAFPDNIAAGKGQVKIFIPKIGIKVTFYEVPDTWVDTDGLSTYEAALGCVNQLDWGPARNVYAAGTLLLHATIISRYTPVAPQVTSWEGSGLIFANNKMCDIEMLFIFLDPPLGKDANGNPATPRAPQVPGQDIQRGHSMVPYAHRNSWYYSKTINVSTFTDASNRPLYPSYPMQRLFSAPGA